jgi:hypothetical protein
MGTHPIMDTSSGHASGRWCVCCRCQKNADEQRVSLKLMKNAVKSRHEIINCQSKLMQFPRITNVLLEASPRKGDAHWWSPAVVCHLFERQTHNNHFTIRDQMCKHACTQLERKCPNFFVHTPPRYFRWVLWWLRHCSLGKQTIKTSKSASPSVQLIFAIVLVRVVK